MKTRDEGASAVDRLQAVPLYHQIFLQLREDILSGRRALGSRLPTEQGLAEIFSVSRMTARRALDELAQTQLVGRKRRVGTHVIFRQAAKPIEGSIDQAIESLHASGRDTQVKIVALEKLPARPPVAEVLRVEEGAPVWRLMQVHWLDDQPLSHAVSYFPGCLDMEVTRNEIKSASTATLLKKAGVVIGAMAQKISASLADATLAHALGVNIGAPLLCVSRTVLDQEERPVQHILAHFRPDRYQIRLDLQSGTS